MARPRSADIVGALERLSLPAFIVTAEGTIGWINPAAAGLFGDVVGRDYRAPFAPESRGVVETAYARKATGIVETTDYEAVMLTADGRRIQVEISSARLDNDDQCMGVFGLVVPEDDAPLPRAPLHELTPRQAEVLRHLARGASTEQIANELGVTVDTTRNHIRDLLKRLGVHSRLGAVVVGRERGLV